jgi:hypothetical protein
VRIIESLPRMVNPQTRIYRFLFENPQCAVFAMTIHIITCTSCRSGLTSDLCHRILVTYK